MKIFCCHVASLLLSNIIELKQNVMNRSICKVSCKEIKRFGNECYLKYNKQERIVIDVDKLSKEIHLSSSNKHKR